MLIECEGTGKKGAKILFIGGAPNSVDIANGCPFTGTAGKLMHKILAQVGIPQSQCYFTYTIKRLMPRNDCGHLITFPKNSRHKVIVKDEFLEYRDFLLREIKEISPNVIVPLGRVALYAICNQSSTSRLRGTILEGTCELSGMKIIPSVLPESIFKSPENYHILLQDLRKIKADAEFPELNLPIRELKVRPTFEEACSYLDWIKETKSTVAVDIETVHNILSSIGFSHSAEYAFCIPFLHKGRDYFANPLEEVTLMGKIAEILEDSTITKIFQNAIFDMYYLYVTYGIVTENFEDTMIGHYALYQDLPKDLGFLCSMFTREPYYKDEGSSAFKGNIPDYDMYWRYNAKDCAVLHEILAKELNYIAQYKNKKVYSDHRDLISCLMYMQKRGIRTNTELLKTKVAESEKRIAELQEKLNEVAGVVLNINSNPQLQNFFYKVKGFPPYKSPITSRIKTFQDIPGEEGLSADAAALKRLKIKGSQEASIILEMRKLCKLESTYLKMKLDEDNRIRSGYDPVGAVSGRLSSRKTIFDTGGNMQNLPKNFKEFLIADDNHILFEVDLSQAESRVVAFLAPEPKLIQAFKSGTDIHNLTASLVFGIPFEDVSTISGSSQLGDGTKSQRDWGKRCNHALNYGMGVKGFSYSYELNEKDSLELIERYHRIYPNIRGKYHVAVEYELASKGYLENMFGRRKKFLKNRSTKKLSTEAFSYKPQSTVADIINNYGLLYYQEELSNTDSFEILNQIHDSIVGQVNLKKEEEGVKLLQELSISLQRELPYIPTFSIPVDIKIGYNLKEMVDVKFSANFDIFYSNFRKTLEGLNNGKKS